MKSSVQTSVQLLRSRPFIAKPTLLYGSLPAQSLGKWSSTSILASRDNSSNLGHPSLDLLKSSISGKKFNDLVHHLNQRSALLVKLENISPPPVSATDLASPITSETQADSKTRRRTYEQDPEFKFERKRGKRHVMIALKQAGSGGGNPNQKLDLVAELDISLRRPGLEKVMINLPKEWKPSIASTPEPQEVSVTAPQGTTTDLPQAESTETQNAARKAIPVDRSGIDEFIQLYLGPLVWSNPNVDILLTYDSQSGPILSFHTNKGENVEQKSLGGLSRSEILHLILYQGAS